MTPLPLSPRDPRESHAIDSDAPAAILACDEDHDTLQSMANQAQVHLVSVSAHNAQRINVPTTWQEHGTSTLDGQEDDREDHGGGPSLALGIAHVAADQGAALLAAPIPGSQVDHHIQLQVELFPVALALLSPSSNTRPSSKGAVAADKTIAAIVSYRVTPAHSDFSSSWLPTSKALIFTPAHTHHTLTVPYPPRTVSAIRIEFWPVATRPSVQCLCPAPVHVKILALNHVTTTTFARPGQANPVPSQLYYPSPAQTVSSVHTSPSMCHPAVFPSHAQGNASYSLGSQATWSPLSPTSAAADPYHGFGSEQQRYQHSEDVPFESLPMHQQDYPAVPDSYGAMYPSYDGTDMHPQHQPHMDISGLYEKQQVPQNQPHLPSMFPPSVPSASRSWTQHRQQPPTSRPPASGGAAAARNSYSIRHGRVSKPPPPSRAHHAVFRPPASSFKQPISTYLSGPPSPRPPRQQHMDAQPTSSDRAAQASEAAAAAADASRWMRGVSVMYMVSPPDRGAYAQQGQAGRAEAEAGNRIRVAIIKTPVGMRDFVHEF